MVHFALAVAVVFLLGWAGLYVLGLIITAFEMHKAVGIAAIIGTVAILGAICAFAL